MRWLSVLLMPLLLIAPVARAQDLSVNRARPPDVVLVTISSLLLARKTDLSTVGSSLAPAAVDLVSTLIPTKQTLGMLA